jgi:outer membrane protein
MSPVTCHLSPGTLAVGALVLGLAWASPAGAAETKIGYVNLGQVFDGYLKTKNSDAVLEKKGKQKEAELEGRLNELKKMRENLELLNPDARETKAKEIEERSEDLQRFRNNTARDLRRERDKIAKDLLEEIQRTLVEYAKANGFSLIVDSQALLYGQETYDVTEEVLTLLNSRAKPAGN